MKEKGYEFTTAALHDLFSHVYVCSKPGHASNHKLRQELENYVRASGGIYLARGKECIKKDWIDDHSWTLRIQLWSSLPATLPLDFRQGKAHFLRVDEAFKRVVPASLSPKEKEDLFSLFVRQLWEDKEELLLSRNAEIRESAGGFSIIYVDKEYLRPIKRSYQENYQALIARGPVKNPPAELPPKPAKRPNTRKASKQQKTDDMSDNAFLHFLGED